MSMWSLGSIGFGSQSRAALGIGKGQVEGMPEHFFED